MLNFFKTRKILKNGMPDQKLIRIDPNDRKPPATTSDENNYHNTSNDKKYLCTILNCIIKREKAKHSYVFFKSIITWILNKCLIFFTTHKYSVIKKLFQSAIQPSVKDLENIVSIIEFIDAEKVFHQPIDQNIFTDYSLFVDQPMALSTMREKIKAGKYKSLNEFHHDFDLMIRNCKTYSPPGNPYHEYAKKIHSIVFFSI